MHVPVAGGCMAQFVDGDFIIHFAGKKGAIKMELLRHYLQEASRNFDSS
jgi:hypothetical protein